jgi:hypothetical protein
MEVRKWLRQQSKWLLFCGFRRTGKAMGQMYQCWWRICREINVFFFSGSNITYFVLYQFVAYLLPLPHIRRRKVSCWMLQSGRDHTSRPREPVIMQPFKFPPKDTHPEDGNWVFAAIEALSEFYWIYSRKSVTYSFIDVSSPAFRHVKMASYPLDRRLSPGAVL